MSNSYCTFIVGWSLCGVPVAQVREVISELRCTPVPLAAPAVHGLVNLRGQIVTAINLAVCLEMWHDSSDDHDVSDKSNYVVVDVYDEKMALLVDDIGPVVEVDESLIEPPPANLRLAIPHFIVQTARLSEGVLLILDLNQLAEIRHGSSF
jgi:purine-binding chemotaxis protein CheW